MTIQPQRPIPAISQAQIENLAATIGRIFRPEKVILFGSRAYGHPRPDSDVDLLVILPFEGSAFAKALEIRNAADPQFGVDLIARRPAEVRERYELGDPLLREALDKGRTLYEAAA